MLLKKGKTSQGLGLICLVKQNSTMVQEISNRQKLSKLKKDRQQCINLKDNFQAVNSLDSINVPLSIEQNTVLITRFY